MKYWSMLFVCLSFASISLSMHRSPTITEGLDQVLAKEIVPNNLRKKNGEPFDANSFFQDFQWSQLHTEVVACQSRDHFQAISGRVEKEWNRQKGSTNHNRLEYQITFCAMRRFADQHGCELHLPECCRKYTDQGPQVALGTIITIK